jgi:hypothetical protein
MKEEEKILMATSISSIISGMIAKLVCHPIDTLKSKI